MFDTVGPMRPWNAHTRPIDRNDPSLVAARTRWNTAKTELRKAEDAYQEALLALRPVAVGDIVRADGIEGLVRRVHIDTHSDEVRVEYSRRTTRTGHWQETRKLAETWEPWG